MTTEYLDKAGLTYFWEKIKALFPARVKTVSGSIATFDAIVTGKIDSIKVEIAPIQSGSGNASPSNVRPITELTGLTVYHSGSDTTNPTEIPISWQSEAGTIYGGFLDLISGVLTKTHHGFQVTPTSIPNISIDSSTANTVTVYINFVTNGNHPRAVKASAISNRFSSAITGDTPGVITQYATNLYIKLPRSEMSGTNTSAARTWLLNNPTVIAYEMETPVTYQLTAQEIRALLGENNIWANVGDVSVVYTDVPTRTSDLVNDTGGGISLSDVYPIGSIYMSVNNTDPGTLFGGTWEQLKDRFLLGAGDTYAAGGTGGEATHKLTADESGVGSHGHNVNTKRTNITVNSNGNTSLLCHSSNGGTAITEANAGGYIGHKSAEASSAHNNMPPYLTVYMWKRTA